MGYAFWRLRPYGDPVGSTGGIASGPITFMRSYDQMCETIAQGGSRRGAQMGIMRVSHPDVIWFIHAKNKDVSLAESLRLNDPDDYRHTSFGDALEEARDILERMSDDEGRLDPALRNAIEGHLSNFNISVGVTDDFMKAVKADEEFTFTNPRTGEPHVATEQTAEMYEWFGLGEYVEAGEILEVPAREVWDRIIDGAQENGEPGVIFIDRINEKHSFPVESTPDASGGEYEMLATNPCGEQPLMEYEACNLGHVNLSTIVAENAPTWEEYLEEAGSPSGGEPDSSEMAYVIEDFLRQCIDWDELERRVRSGTRFLDNVVTMSNFPIPEIEETVADNRKIGLGIMGLAQMYIQLGVEYGTDPANEVARHLMTWINHTSKDESNKLAQTRGSFANWDDSKYADPEEYADWFKHHVGRAAEEFPDGFPVRNHNTTTIAPTGTTGMIGNTTGGCEPMYNVAYYKNVSEDIQGEEKLVEFDDYFIRILKANDVDVDEVRSEALSLMEANEFDGVNDLESVPDELARLFVTTGDLSAKEHASIQCALQDGVDSAISKTVNAPNDATLDDAREVFEYLYDNGGKGVTYYRDGTRSKQVLTTRDENMEFAGDADREEVVLDWVEDEYGVTGDDPEAALKQAFEVEEPQTSGNGVKARPRPKVTRGETHLIETGFGRMYVIINEDEHGLHEVFVTVGKSGGFTESMVEAIGRLISLNLRAGVDLEEIIDQLDGIRSPEINWDNGEQVQSIPDGIALALKRYPKTEHMEEVNGDGVSTESSAEIETFEESEKSGMAAVIDQGITPECPDCGASVKLEGGCPQCAEECGWSKC